LVEEPDKPPVPPVDVDPPAVRPETEPVITVFPTEADFIDPGRFLLIEGQRLSKSAQVALLRDTEELLGCSQYQMAKLLGMEIRNYSAVKHERRRFGSGRLGQIIKLLHLHIRGVPLNLAKSIYWKEGLINWRNGNVTGENHLLERGWEIPAKEGADNGGASEALTQWGRSPGPQSKRGSNLYTKRGPSLPKDAGTET
jgi:transcriptional regulator with XRE-family HTH domain